MKFYMDAGVFKSKIERALIVTRRVRKEDPEFIGCIKIIADKEKNTVHISATNIGTYINIKCVSSEVDVAESGEAVLDSDTIKRLFNVTGRCLYYSDNDSLAAKNNRKATRVPSKDVEWPEFPDTSDRTIMAYDVDNEDFISTMENLQNFVSNNMARPTYTGFNLNAKQHRMSAVSGYHVLDRVVNWEFSGTDKINIPLVILKELKKISAKWTNKLFFYVCDKKRYLQIIGCDFEYTVRLIDGDFLDVERAIPKDLKYSFKLDSKKLADVAKEYESYNPYDDKVPMSFVNVNGDMYSVFRRSDYETCDSLGGINTRSSIGNLPDDFYAAMDPEYIRDVADVFKKLDDSVTVCCDGKESSPWVFTCYDNMGYRAMTLPVRRKEGAQDVARSAVNSMLAA